MKQVAKTQQVLDRLRASFGPDADVSKLPVYEAVMLTPLPLRKGKGIFKNARVTPSTFQLIANSVNAESAPMQVMHDEGELPLGRLFYCEVIDGDELRGLYTIDDPEIAAKIDKGTIDQVSVGYMPAHINCSACGFDYLGPGAPWECLYTLTCPEDHVLNEDGVFAWIDGIQSFYELSLVGKGAAVGAKIVGPSDQKLAGNEAFQRLAASATHGFAGVRLIATLKETPVNIEELVGRLEAGASERATLAASVTSLTADRDARAAEVVTLTARVAELEPAAARTAAAEASLAEAVAALQSEAKLVLTACGKPTENLPSAVAELTALISEHRAEFAAVIPAGGRAKPAGGDVTPSTDVRASAAFRAPAAR